MGGVSIEIESQDPQKAYQGSILNLHTKMQLPRSSWRRVRRRTNTKYKKNRPKDYISGAGGGEREGVQ